METQFRVEAQDQGKGTLISLSGELDLASSPALEEAFARVFESDASLIVVDLRSLEFMDSTGLSILVRAHHRAEESGTQVHLVKGPPQVQRLLSLTGVAERLSVIEAPEDVLDGG